ncbi:vanadium-dependent haloperoxidase, partial [Amycolatopsis sp. SID8362]|uniref:vanadium-dependent haloperoxidase n=1 Tax=Amycolatopsis sp. SID8362 TaxID=2690346 RepID=UPI00136D5064
SAATPPLLPPGTAPGEYRPTPPAFAPAAFTHWAAVTPFVLDRASRFRPGAYPALSGAAYAKAVQEVAAAGRDTGTTRTADETQQARFWAAPIWNYWNEITQSVVGGSHPGLVVAARVFARLNLAFADAVIAFYEAKYHYRIWRPVTAVRLAADDGNPATQGIPDWSSLATTPPDPAYPGAHSVISQAGAQVLRQEYGPRRPLAVTSEALPGVVRHFTSFQDVADEAGLSRIVAGVHTRLDHDAGRRLGQDVATFVLRS